jgi:hypothetical protein
VKEKSQSIGDLGACVDVVAFSFAGVALCDLFKALEDDVVGVLKPRNRRLRMKRDIDPYCYFRRVVFLDSVHDDSHVDALSYGGQQYLLRNAIHFRGLPGATFHEKQDSMPPYWGRLAVMKVNGCSTRRGCSTIEVAGFSSNDNSSDEKNGIDSFVPVAHELIPFVTLDETFAYLEADDESTATLFTNGLGIERDKKYVMGVEGDIVENARSAFSMLTLLYAWVGIQFVVHFTGEYSK